MTIAEHTSAARERLVHAGLSGDEAARDARLLARHVLHWDAARLIVSGSDAAPAGFQASYDDLIARRSHREPVAYIVGEREFWGLPFVVSRDVLVPRPETELLIETVIELIPDRSASLHAADVGTGSGCLAVALAVEYPNARLEATDTSRSALAIADTNLTRHGVADRVTTIEVDLLPSESQNFDLIVSNPPYVALADRDGLAPEVRDYEPASALFAGGDGLDVIRALLKTAAMQLARSGVLLFEFGFGQEQSVRELISGTPGITMVGLRRDLQSIPRVAIARRD